MTSPLQVDFNGYRFTLTALQEIRLPSYKGATFRGAFGYALRRAICTQPGRKCSECLLRKCCVYPFIFEPTAELFPNSTQKRFQDFPRPFVIRPPHHSKRLVAKEADFDFELILIGQAVDYLPYFVYAFRELGQAGLGVTRGNFNLKAITDFSGNLLYDGRQEILSNPGRFFPTVSATFKIQPGQSLTLEFITPTRIKEAGDLLVHPTFRQIFQSLLTRGRLLSRYYCHQKIENFDYQELLKMAGRIKTECDQLRWYDWGRFSTRQGASMKLGGFLGRITFSGNIEPFLPLLILGQYIHLGKGCTFGLGEYRLTCHPYPSTRRARPTAKAVGNCKT